MSIRTAHTNTLILMVSLLMMAGCESLLRDSRPVINEAEVLAIPDAVPKIEPRSQLGNPESYEVFGRTYHVMEDATGLVQHGTASWYGPDFHGKKTSSGDIYNMYQMTAAHKTIPIPAYVRVNNLENGKSIVVRVNDRGPFVEGRIIDLSYVAAKKLGLIANGTAKVELRVLDAQGNNNSEIIVTTIDDMNPLPVSNEQVTPSIAPVNEQVAMNPAISTETALIQDMSYIDSNVTQVQRETTYYIQLGAFSRLENAARLSSKLESEQSEPVEVSTVLISGTEFHRVRTGPYYNQTDAEKVLLLLQQYPGAKIIRE